jgi:hypothetical protein
MHGPTCILWANLTAGSLQAEQQAAVDACKTEPEKFALTKKLDADKSAAGRNAQVCF